MNHRCEVAAWGLDHHAMPHMRRMLRPGLHVAEAMARTRQTEMPAFVSGGATTLGALDILKALEKSDPERSLVPAGLESAVYERCQTLMDTLAPAAERVWYSAALPESRLCVTVFGSGLSTVRKSAYRFALKPVRRTMAVQLGLPRSLAAAEQTLEECLESLKYGPQGVGDGFTMAHLVAAGLLSFFVPRPYAPYNLPDPLPAGIAELRERYGKHPAVRWAIQTYALRRGVSMAENLERRGSDVL
ncbi:MAG: glutathione S-transferase [Myxococcota bacterium]|jgi:glutathione S-transferase